MAFNDWNHDGKKDWADSFIEYQMISQSEGESSTGSSGNSGCGIVGWAIIILLLLSGLSQCVG